MLEIKEDTFSQGPDIVVIGVGGGGNNALDRMIENKVAGVRYIAVNTDSQVLNACQADERVQIGKKLTRGYGAGADPSVGEAAAVENEEDLRQAINNADMAIITCGLGGGTGTGAAPVIAKQCHDAGILTVAIVTEPFSFESVPRTILAKKAVDELKTCVDTLIVIPNDKLLQLSDRQLTLENAFLMADSVLHYAIEGITNIVYNKGIVNLDFNDLRTTLANKGIGHLGIGTIKKDSSILEAVKQAINSPLLDTSIAGATNILINTTGNINLMDLNEAISYVREIAGEGVNIIWGTVSSNEEQPIITLMATGMSEKKEVPIIHKTIQPKHEESVHKSAPIPESKVSRKEIEIPPFLQQHLNK